MNRLATILVVLATVQQLTLAADVDLDRLRDYLQRRALQKNEASAAENAQRILQADDEPQFEQQEQQRQIQSDPQGLGIYQYKYNDESEPEQQFANPENPEERQYLEQQRQIQSDPQGLGVYQYKYDDPEPEQQFANPENLEERQFQDAEQQYIAQQAFQEQDNGPIIEDEEPAAEQRGFVDAPQDFEMRNYEQRAAYDQQMLQGPALSDEELMAREAAEQVEQERMAREEQLAESQRMMEEDEFVAQQRALAMEQEQRALEDDQMLEENEVKGINEQMQADAAEAIETRDRGNGGRRPRNNTRWEAFKNQKVIKATKYERDIGDIKRLGLVATVEGNKRYFIYIYGYGNVHAVNAIYMSDNWVEKESKEITKSTLGMFLKAAGVGRNSYEAVNNMWELE